MNLYFKHDFVFYVLFCFVLIIYYYYFLLFRIKHSVSGASGAVNEQAERDVRETFAAGKVVVVVMVVVVVEGTLCCCQIIEYVVKK